MSPDKTTTKMCYINIIIFTFSIMVTVILFKKGGKNGYIRNRGIISNCGDVLAKTRKTI